ncbi:NUDIX domain-containing protein [Patescibacteria group bacterium]|nr:NUDIX domain-containing protein [Patescibacteria group bacterium]
MSEILSTFLLEDVERSIPMERDEFYKEQTEVFKKVGKPTRACEIVHVLIFNSHGELLLQKRSYDKNHNAGLLDKSVGGHIRYGDTADYSVMVETVQELQTPSIVLKNDDDFKKTLVLLSDYLSTIAVVKHSHSKIYNLKRVISGETIIIANKLHAYFGLYDGSIKPVDREASGVLFYSLANLDKEMISLPEAFTSDMHILLKELRSEIEVFLGMIKGRQNNSIK